jgi:hypothetical protein
VQHAAGDEGPEQKGKERAVIQALPTCQLGLATAAAATAYLYSRSSVPQTQPREPTPIGSRSSGAVRRASSRCVTAAGTLSSWLRGRSRTWPGMDAGESGREGGAEEVGPRRERSL